MTDFAGLLRASVAHGGLVALPLAFLGGVVTGLNPCCLPMYPAGAAVCCASRAEGALTTVRNALAFVAGMAAATALLGIVAALAGQALTGLGGWITYAVALVPLLMGLHLLGWLRLPLPSSGVNVRVRGVGGAFIAGLLLSLVLAPCGTPLLASVLSFAAYKKSIAYGAALLFVYGVGAGVPVLLVGTAASGLAQRLDARGWRPWVDRATGVGLLLVGFYLLWTA